MKYLIKTQEVWRVNSEEEAKALIEEAKNEPYSVLAKYSSEAKERKSKGQAEDEWYRVTLNKVFQEEKEPVFAIGVDYSRKSNFSFVAQSEEGDEE